MIHSIGMKTSRPRFGAVLEHGVQRHVPAAISTPGCEVGMSAQVMPIVFLVADEMIGVVRAERETEQRRHRSQRYVALSQADAQGRARACLVLAPATMP
jgi:hypothetical protein